MRLLLDTHIVVWLAKSPALLTTGERALIGTSEKRVVSAVTIWELRLKWHSFHASGDRKGPVSPEEVARYYADNGFDLLPLSPNHAAASLDHPLPHKHPFDELLLVQAQVEGLRLLTRDSRLAGHPLALAA